MPTYEYRCRACGNEFERFQKISDSPVRTCPSCKKRRVERLISSGGGIVFKGTGFYATDYRNDGPGQGSRDSGGSSGESSKDAASGDSSAAAAASTEKKSSDS